MDQEFIFLDDNNIDVFYNIFIEAKQDQNINYNIDLDRFNDYLLQLNVKEETSFLLKDNNENIGIFISAVRGERAYISTLAVLNKYRGLGYGRVLLQKGNSLLLENRCKNVMLEVLENNDSALKLYQSEGFKTINEILNFRNEKVSNYFNINPNAYLIKKEDPLIFHILYKVFHKKERPWQKQLTSVLQKLRKGSSEIFIIKKNDVTCGYCVITRSGSLLQVDDFAVNKSEEDKIGLFLSRVVNSEDVIIANSFYNNDQYCNVLINNGFYLYLKQYEMEKKLL